MCTDKETVFVSRSESETEEAGFRLARSLSSGSTVLLRGDLGAGKTVFSRGFARGLGITEPVSSPTYTIVQEYERPGGGRLYHLDLYRISGVEAALAFGADEFFADPAAIALVEWPERIEGLLPPGAVNVRLEHLSESERRISICR
ncbi:MAG: tRNA (adenosine(37)-N6)-threonylcarbamoyltransferase complex ATPase subunit type 1 TsaE [Lentisphaeria bacterium]|nr:tRNA (adenosine(37)-N6)-threonylcarbamoyltransferase complex ATPase subunit type 1 TsaE [Lentisphaeria bacterium]